MTQQDSVQQEIDDLVKGHKVVLFMKGNRQTPQCGFSARVIGILDELLDDYQTMDVLARAEIRNGVKEYSSWPTVPQLYVEGEFVGGCDIITEMAGSGELHQTLGIEMPEVSEPKISITPNALEALRDAPVPEGHAIRLGISKQFQYELGIAQQSEFDFVIEIDGVKIVIDRMSAARANGLEIDFASEEGQAGFRINNPNEPAQA
jgi:monothiol glutaredoxin